MENSKVEQDEYLYYLNRWLYFSGMLVEQCEGWLSAEEGDENLLREYYKGKTSLPN